MESESLHDIGLEKTLIPVRNTREISKKDMILNDSLPKMEVDPETYTVKADGEELHCEPAKSFRWLRDIFYFDHDHHQEFGCN